MSLLTFLKRFPDDEACWAHLESLRWPHCGGVANARKMGRAHYLNCNACGGTGHLLCCDGCDKAFHFRCVDPPLDQHSSELNEPWFCHTCVAKRAPAPKPPRGLFAALLQGLERRNPTEFLPPTSVREYFEGVATSKDGKFVEPPNSKTRSAVSSPSPHLR